MEVRLDEKFRKLRLHVAETGANYADALRAFRGKREQALAYYEGLIESTAPEDPNFVRYVRWRDMLNATLQQVDAEIDLYRIANENGG